MTDKNDRISIRDPQGNEVGVLRGGPKRPEYEPTDDMQRLAYLVEECGEVLVPLATQMGKVLAALGKTLRWGPESYNPEVAPRDRETNAAWLLRESADLQAALHRAVPRLRTMVEENADSLGPGASRSRVALEHVDAAQPHGNAPLCPKCGWANFVIRKTCRNCGEDLVMHPDPSTDAEVRFDAEDGRRYEAATQLSADHDALKGWGWDGPMLSNDDMSIALSLADANTLRLASYHGDPVAPEPSFDFPIAAIEELTGRRLLPVGVIEGRIRERTVLFAVLSGLQLGFRRGDTLGRSWQLCALDFACDNLPDFFNQSSWSTEKRAAVEAMFRYAQPTGVPAENAGLPTTTTQTSVDPVAVVAVELVGVEWVDGHARVGNVELKMHEGDHGSVGVTVDAGHDHVQRITHCDVAEAQRLAVALARAMSRGAS